MKNDSFFGFCNYNQRFRVRASQTDTRRPDSAENLTSAITHDGDVAAVGLDVIGEIIMTEGTERSNEIRRRDRTFENRRLFLLICRVIRRAPRLRLFETEMGKGIFAAYLENLRQIARRSKTDSRIARQSSQREITVIPLFLPETPNSPRKKIDEG